MNKFNPGDRVRVIHFTNPKNKRMLGNQATVLKILGDEKAFPWPGYEKYVGRLYPAPGTYYEIYGSGMSAAFHEDLLRKLLPDSDSYHRSTWQDYHDAIGREVVV